MTPFIQSTTAHCVEDALAHVKRDNPNAASVEVLDDFDMGFGNLTMFRFEVTLAPTARQQASEYEAWMDDTPMFFAHTAPVRVKSSAGWAA